MSKKVESVLPCGSRSSSVSVKSVFLGVVFAAELQCAADGDRGAVDVRAVVECEDVCGGVVGEGMLQAVNTDGAGVCSAVILP